MSAPSRRRNPTITRGRKSDRKKRKMEKRSLAPVQQSGGLEELRQKSNEDRKKLILGDASNVDKSILSEPSTVFFEKTERIRSKKKSASGSVILLEEPRFQTGVSASKVKQERMIVIDGDQSSVFHELAGQFNRQKKNLKQEQRESQPEVLERARKLEEQNKKIAAAEREKKRLAKQKEELEAARLIAVEKEKAESERLAKIELRRQEEAARALAIQQQKLETERLAKLELERLEQVSRTLAIQQQKLETERLAKRQAQLQQEQDRLEAIEEQKLESERLSKIESERQLEPEQLQMANPEMPKAKKEFVSKPKGGFWRSLLAMLKGLFKSKSLEKGPSDQKEIAVDTHQDSESVVLTELSIIQDESTSKEVHQQPVVEPQQESPAPGLQVQEPKTEPLEEVAEVAEKVVEQVHEPKEELWEEVAEVAEIVEIAENVVEQVTEVIQEEVPFLEDSNELVEPEQEPPEPEVGVEELELEPLEEVIVEDITKGILPEAEQADFVPKESIDSAGVPEQEPLEPQVQIEAPIIKPFEEEVLEKVVEDVLDDGIPDVAEEGSGAEDSTEVGIGTEQDDPIIQDSVASGEEPSELEAPSEALEIEPLEEVVVEDVIELGLIESEEELPEPQTDEVVLSLLRITLRKEPQPLAFIKRILLEKHGLSQKDVKILVEHVASPFSICKTMNHDIFQKFISSFGDDHSSFSGVEQWTKVIELIGPDALSERQQVEIYDLFMGQQKKSEQRAKTVAMLYHFLPEKFERWWQKEMIPTFVQKKYSTDHKFFQNRTFSREAVEEARMLLCAFAIEKPSRVADEYTYAKHKAGRIHEDQTEQWLKKGGGNIHYITEDQIRGRGGQKYGNKYVNAKITPDLLLRDPIQLSPEGQHIHWIDAKKHFVDPSLSPEPFIEQFCRQIETYVQAYGPGLVVWGKNFSEEWNEATEGVVQHIKI